MSEPDLSQARDCRPAGNATGCQCQWVTWNLNINITVFKSYLIKTIRKFYSLFMFRFYCKIIGLSFQNVSGSGLTSLWPAPMGRAWA